MGDETVDPWDQAKAFYSTMLKVPMSGIPELDAMIRESRRLDMATAAMNYQIEGATWGDIRDGADDLAEAALAMADALLAASGKEKP